MNNSSLPTALAAWALLASALYADPLQGQTTGRSQVSSASPADVQVTFPAHELRPGDVVRIRIWPDTTLGGEFPVEDTGAIHLPILGRMSVAGLTLDELRADLRARYEDAMRTPIVSVTVRFPVSVLGAVRGPGLYVAQPPQTVFDAVSMAGGFLEEADLDDVRLFRADSVFEIDAERLLEEGGGRLELALRSGDRILVPEKSSFEARDVLLVVQSIATIATFIRVIQ